MRRLCTGGPDWILLALRAADIMDVPRSSSASHKRYSLETMTDDLRRAMVHAKQAAAHHRNNCIGTEHLLWGLSAEDNGTTGLLQTAGI